MGEASHLDKDMRIHNRSVRLGQKGLLLEADPGHAEILIQSMGLEDKPFVVTPATRPWRSKKMRMSMTK